MSFTDVAIKRKFHRDDEDCYKRGDGLCISDKSVLILTVVMLNMIKACERVQNETGERILNNARAEDKYVKKVNKYARTMGDSEDTERYENEGEGVAVMQ